RKGGEDFRAAHYDSSLPSIEVRKVCTKHLPTIEKFCESVADDPTSKAMALAIKGWLMNQGTYKRESEEVFKDAEELDAELPWIHLFQAMIGMAAYLWVQPWPGSSEIEAGVLLEETPDAKALRTGYERLLGSAAASKVWGESEARDIREVIRGLRAMTRGELEAAERGLGKVQFVAELAWIRAPLLFARAKVRFFRRDYEAGIGDIEAYIQAYPGNARAWGIRGIFLHEMGKTLDDEGGDPRALYQKSISELDRAIELVPGDLSTGVHRGAVYWHWGQYEARHGIDPRSTFLKAEKDFKAYMEKERDRPAAWDWLGHLMLDLGKARASQNEDPLASYEKAVEAFTMALKLEFEKTKNYNNRGLAHAALGRRAAMKGGDFEKHFRQAMEDHSEAVKRDDNYATAWLNRGNAASRLGQALVARGRNPMELYRSALSDYDKALEKDPSLVEAFNNRAACHLAKATALSMGGADPRDALRKAIGDYETAIGKSPDLVDLRANLGVALLELGNAERRRRRDGKPHYEKAREVLEKTLKTDREMAAAHLTFGSVLCELGRLEEKAGVDPFPKYRRAIASFHEYQKRRPRDPMGYNNCGGAYMDIGVATEEKGGDPRNAYTESLVEYGKALERNPRHWMALANRGILFNKLGRFSESLEAYKQADAVVRGRVPNIRKQMEGVRRKAEAPAWVREILRARKLMGWTDDYATAGESLEKAVAEAPEKPDDGWYARELSRAHYALACTHALASQGKKGPESEPREVESAAVDGHRTSALSHLRRSMELGFDRFDHARKDPDLAGLRDLPELKKLLAEFEGKGK
ncbi:MAG: tetratricopeptide repeat protein, partial [Planctomycetota bacterium]